LCFYVLIARTGCASAMDRAQGCSHKICTEQRRELSEKLCLFCLTPREPPPAGRAKPDGRSAAVWIG